MHYFLWNCFTCHIHIFFHLFTHKEPHVSKCTYCIPDLDPVGAVRTCHQCLQAVATFVVGRSLVNLLWRMLQETDRDISVKNKVGLYRTQSNLDTMQSSWIIVVPVQNTAMFTHTADLFVQLGFFTGQNVTMYAHIHTHSLSHTHKHTHTH